METDGEFILLSWEKKMYSHDNNSWLSPLTFLEEKKTTIPYYFYYYYYY